MLLSNMYATDMFKMDLSKLGDMKEVSENVSFVDNFEI